MKIILKPAGIVVLCTAIGGLSWLVVRNQTPSSATAAVAAKGAVATKDSLTASVATGKEWSTGGGFENDYKPTKKEDAKAGVDITGMVADKWTDNSGWGSIALHYEKDEVKPYSGRAAQKITVKKIGTAHTQFVQYIEIPVGTQLEGTIWARSDTPLKQGEAFFVLRDLADPNGVYGQTDMLLTPEWKPYTVRGTVGKKGPTMFGVYVRRAGVSVWVDEASLRSIK